MSSGKGISSRWTHCLRQLDAPLVVGGPRGYTQQISSTLQFLQQSFIHSLQVAIQSFFWA